MTTRNANARNQVLDLLKQDHKDVKKQFREFEKLDAAQDGEAAQDLASRICGALEAHAQLEEELFYPAVRDALAKKGEDDLVDEALVEHQSLKQLIAGLRDMSMDDPKWKASMTVLSEYVKHHVKEEEGEMFEMLGRTKIEWEPLLEQMQQRHEALMAEHGVMQGEDESQLDVEQAMQASRDGSRANAGDRSAR